MFTRLATKALLLTSPTELPYSPQSAVLFHHAPRSCYQAAPDTLYPIVLLALGDTCVFSIDAPSVEPPYAELMSGDAVVICGADLRYPHGLFATHPGTAPAWLGMRQGTIAISIRQINSSPN